MHCGRAGVVCHPTFLTHSCRRRPADPQPCWIAFLFSSSRFLVGSSSPARRCDIERIRCQWGQARRERREKHSRPEAGTRLPFCCPSVCETGAGFLNSQPRLERETLPWEFHSCQVEASASHLPTLARGPLQYTASVWSVPCEIWSRARRDARLQPGQCVPII